MTHQVSESLRVHTVLYVVLYWDILRLDRYVGGYLYAKRFQPLEKLPPTKN